MNKYLVNNTRQKMTEILMKYQAERAKKYPKDRIPFLPFDEVAEADMQVFEAFRKGEISCQVGRNQIARNNYLKNVTKIQFMEAYEALGYDTDE